MFWTKTDEKIYVKNAWGSAKDSGVEPGMEVVKVGDKPAVDWLADRIEELRDLQGFSTPQQAFFYATHWGLRGEVGTSIDIEVRTLKGKREKKTLTYTRANQVPSGPAFWPKAKGQQVGKRRRR